MIPKHLKIENFFSYTESELDFDFSSALIVGENGAGKSTIFEAIAWALFGKSKYKHADNIVKRGRKMAKVVLTFEHDKKTYKIIRKRHSKHASQSSLEFYELINGKEEPIKADTNSQLDGKIRDVIKSNYDVFVNSSYFKQGSVSDFLDGTSTKRQKLVSSILNLERWDKYMDIANKELKEIDKELALLKYKLSDLDNVEEDIATCESSIAEKQDRTKELNRREELLRESIKTLEVKVSNLKTSDKNLSDYQDIKNKYDYILHKISELEATKNEKLQTIEKASKDREVNQKAIFEIDKQVEELIPNLDLKEKVVDISEKEGKLYLLKVDVKLYEDRIKHLQENDECMTCGSVHSDPTKKQKEIDKAKVIIDELTARIAKGDRVVSRLKSYADTVRQTELEIDKYTSRKRNIENNIRLHDLKIEGAQSTLEIIEKSLVENQRQKESLEQIVKSTQDIVDNNNFDELKSDLDSRKIESKEVSDERSELLYAVGSLDQKLDRLYKDKEQKDEVNTKVEELNKKATVYSGLVRSFSRNGIQAVIIDNVVEELAKVTNEQLNQFTTTPTYVEFVTQKKDSKDSWKETLDIAIRTASGISEFEGLSGGEGFRVAFSIRLALSHIQARRMGGETQLLMLDEVSTNLDPKGLELFVSIIRSLEKDIKIMVITHDDKLKEEFEHIIYVDKSGDDSSMHV